MKGRKRKPLKEGYVYCKECNGTGKTKFRKIILLHGWITTNKCPRCDGTGQLDWIENIMGIRNRERIGI